MPYPKEIIFDTTVLLETICPDRLLIIGEQFFNISDEYALQCQIINKEYHLTKLPSSAKLSNPAFNERYDLAIVGNVLETKSKTDSEHIIGRLRDLCCPKFIIVADLNQSHWQENELLGFGLNKYNRATSAESHEDLEDNVMYQFNIDAYKKTPDWFNPKNWANPNLWNKFWW